MNEPLKPLYDKRVTCLHCHHKFSSKKVRTKFARPIKTDTDFCSYYEEDECNPVLYFINVCPECGFSFSDHTPSYFPPGAYERIEKEIVSKWVKHSFSDRRTKQTAIETYKLAILSASLKGEKHIVLAGLCMRLAWLYRQLEQTDLEERFLRLALQEYEQAYTYGDYETSEVPEISVIYLIGEIYRRLGNYHDAIQYFSQAANHSMKSMYPKYVQMAREQWRVTREQYAKMGNEQAETDMVK